MTNVIEVREISVRLGGIEIFEGASVAFEQGHTYALTGPNGSGKSVLLKTICGFITPESGQVWVDPKYLSARRTFPDRFGISIDGPAYLPGRTGLDNLMELARIRKRVGVTEAREVLQRVGLDPDLKQRARNYSLGMKQKLSLAQALMEDPEVLLLDEPFNALDVDSVARVKTVLAEEREKGTTIVFTSHHRDDVADLSDTVFRIRGVTIEPEPSPPRNQAGSAP